jgi:hypothetical protein
MEVFYGDVHGKISLFRANEIGRSRIVLRLYSVTGVVPPNTPVVARYEYPVFNLVVVAQRRRRSMWKRTEHAELPKASAGSFLHVPLLSAFLWSFQPESSGVGYVYLAFAIGHCLRPSVNAQ